MEGDIIVRRSDNDHEAFLEFGKNTLILTVHSQFFFKQCCCFEMGIKCSSEREGVREGETKMTF